MIILEISLFLWKMRNFSENAKYFAHFPQLSALFRPARPGRARPYKRNGIPYILIGWRRLRGIFRGKSLFRKINVKIRKNDFLADFSFFRENHDFHEIYRVAETAVFPMLFQWFWRVDGLEKAKIT